MIKLNLQTKEIIDSSQLSLTERLGILIRLQRYALPYWDRILLRMISTVALSFLGVIPPLLVPRILDEAFPRRDVNLLIRITLISLGIGVISRVLGFLAGAERAESGGAPCNVMAAYTMPRIAVTIKQDFFRHVQRLSAQFYSRRPIGEHMFRCSADCDDAAFLASELIPKTFSVLQRVVVLVFVIRSFGSWILLPVGLYLLLFFVTKHKIATGIRNWDRRYRIETQRLESACREILYPWKLVKAYTRERLVQCWYGMQACRSARTRFMRDILMQFDSYFTFVALGAFWGVLGTIMGWLVIKGSMTLGEQGAVGGLVIMLIRPFEDVISAVQLFRQKLVPAERMLETLAVKPDVVDIQNPERFVVQTGCIEFRNVTFGYDPKRPVLRNLNLKVNGAEKLAIVGHTGAGKSTLLNLIVRLYDPQEGEILIDGVNIRYASQDQLRQAIGIVPQQIITFADTIEANVRFGNPRADAELFQRVVHIARVDEFALRMPNGYGSYLSESGGLSGGQQQRIALARALIRDPKILLLDEATSALDPETEVQVIGDIDKFFSETTRVVVAHNLITARTADRVVVLRDGEIKEEGTHDALMASGTYYRGLWCNEEVGGLA